MKRTITAVIPTLNAEGLIEALVQALFAQSLPPDNIVIVDSESTDQTADIAKRLGVTLIRIARREFDHGGTRTFAAGKTDSDFILFLTQDVRIADGHAIEKLARPLLEDEQVAAAYGRQLPHDGADLFARSIRSFNYGEESYRSSNQAGMEQGIHKPFISNNFSIYRRDVMEDLGWFGDSKICSEDLFAGARILNAGYSIEYIAEAAVYHSHNLSTIEYFRRYFDIGVFHARNRWIRQRYGSASKEGWHFVRFELAEIVRHGKHVLLGLSIFRAFIKYLGYLLGKIHYLFPRVVCKRLSGNPQWWKRL